MRRIRELFGMSSPLEGPELEHILGKVAKGNLAPEDAAHQIRRLASKLHIPAWLPRLLGIIGVLFIMLGIGFAARAFVFSIGAERTRGTVVEVVGSDECWPIVEYGVGGERLRVHSSVRSSPPAYSVGENVPVLYQPDKPQKAQIDSFRERWLLPAALTGSGIWAVLLGFFWPKFSRAIMRAG